MSGDLAPTLIRREVRVPPGTKSGLFAPQQASFVVMQIPAPKR